jgi:hypothetical protein
MLDFSKLPPRLDTFEAVEYLRRRHGIKTTIATLNKRASLGGGPEFQKDGRWRVYPIENLDAWAATRLTRLVTRNCELRDELSGQNCEEPRADAPK